jgi:hypothetical protein
LKEKSLHNLHKKSKNLKKPKKTQKKTFLVGFLGGFFWVGFLGGFFNANPAYSIISLRAVVTYLERLSSIAPREFMAAGDEPAAAAVALPAGRGPPRPPFSFTTVSIEGRLPADDPASDDGCCWLMLGLEELRFSLSASAAVASSPMSAMSELSRQLSTSSILLVEVVVVVVAAAAAAAAVDAAAAVVDAAAVVAVVGCSSSNAWVPGALL